jgi:hypothetical protein
LVERAACGKDMDVGDERMGWLIENGKRKMGF